MENELLNLVTYFIIYSFFGWVLESIFKTVNARKFVNSGFLFGPFCPIYGFGAIIMYLFLRDTSSNIVLTFCLGFVALSIWEYAVGTLLEKAFNTKYWDYSERKFNLSGRVCLENSIFWGILGVVFINIMHPLVVDGLSKINQEWILIADVVIMLLIIIDSIINININLAMKNKLKHIEELNDRIKEKIEEIKQKGKDKEIKSESLQAVVDSLKKKREKIIIRSYRHIYRIKRAFPTIKSEQITKLLDKKSDFLRKDK